MQNTAIPQKKLTNPFYLTQLAILSAIVILMTFAPYVGYIFLGGVSITLLHIPVILGAAVMGPKAGGILGTVWGLTCWIKAVISPPSPLEGILFRNPIVAVLPRILAGLVAGWIFLLFVRILKNNWISAGVSALLGTLTNTIFTLGAIFLFFGGSKGSDLGITALDLGSFLKFILATLAANGIAEMVAAIVLVVPISQALLALGRRLKA